MISERTIHTLELNKVQALLREFAVSDLGKATVDSLSPAASLPEAERLLLLRREVGRDDAGHRLPAELLHGEKAREIGRAHV